MYTTYNIFLSPRPQPGYVVKEITTFHHKTGLYTIPALRRVDHSIAIKLTTYQWTLGLWLLKKPNLMRLDSTNPLPWFTPSRHNAITPTRHHVIKPIKPSRHCDALL